MSLISTTYRSVGWLSSRRHIAIPVSLDPWVFAEALARIESHSYDLKRLDRTLQPADFAVADRR
jgi:hypothetical protein